MSAAPRCLKFVSGAAESSLVWKRIEAIKLDDIVASVARKQQWTLEKAAAVEREYRLFLWVSFLTPGQSLVPTCDVDKLWHGHLLDTERYARDCQSALNRFLHHRPLYGRPGERERLRKQYEFTRTRFQTITGMELPEYGGVDCSDGD